MRSIINNLTTHPCFNRAAGQWFDSVHLAVAPRCNIKCLYCTKGGNCPHENITVRVNSILIPGINDIHLKEVAYTAKSLGASLMNLRPMVPAAELSRMRPPTSLELDRAATSVSPIIPLAPGCLGCRDHRATAVK